VLARDLQEGSPMSSIRSSGVLAARHCASWWLSSGSHCRRAAPPARCMSGGKVHDLLKQIMGGGRGDGKVKIKRSVPPHIERPDYADTGTPLGQVPKLPWQIPVNSPEEIECAREAGRISREVPAPCYAARCPPENSPLRIHSVWMRDHSADCTCGPMGVQVLDLAGRAVRVGVSTDEIDALVHEETIKRGAYPSPLNYHGFPRSVCTSINEVVCHGIPDENRFLKARPANTPPHIPAPGSPAASPRPDALRRGPPRPCGGASQHPPPPHRHRTVTSSTSTCPASCAASTATIRRCLLRASRTTTRGGSYRSRTTRGRPRSGSAPRACRTRSSAASSRCGAPPLLTPGARCNRAALAARAARTAAACGGGSRCTACVAAGTSTSPLTFRRSLGRCRHHHPPPPLPLPLY